MEWFKKSEINDDKIARWMSVFYLTGIIILLLIACMAYIDQFPRIPSDYLLPVSVVIAIIVSRIRIIRIGVLEAYTSDFTQGVMAMLALILVALLGIVFIANYYEVDFLLNAIELTIQFLRELIDSIRPQ
ncbi:MAG: hypothetical protein NPIRA05_00400 [Nitrospirales bacterium]|nr:MAG: hypothetical protein NPIRA05_00400 [Nitrospirales bacterium]